jgi:hypothetical protein
MMIIRNLAKVVLAVYKGVLPDYTQKFKGVDKAQMNEEFQHEIGYQSIARM